MSPKVGPLNLSDEGDQSSMMISQRPYSETTAEVIDAEVRRIVEECFEEALRLLGENRDKLVALTTALLREESLNEEQILQVTGLPAKPRAAPPGLAGARRQVEEKPEVPAPT